MQCVILIGGIGSRLGDAVKNTPKPMLEVHGLPFLVHLIKELSRFSIDHFLLLAGYKAHVVEEYFATHVLDIPAKITVLTEEKTLGTAGALVFAKDHLEEEFFLCNGDSFFDCNILELSRPFYSANTLLRMGLKPVLENSRYGHVRCEGDFVQSFSERDPNARQGVMNTGLYYVKKSIVKEITELPCSLEQTIFPKLAKERKIEQHTYTDAYFIDIGIPEDLEKARNTLIKALTRPAIFFDRDGVLNHDAGHTHKVEDLQWIDGAKESIKFFNDKGYFVFVVTNQAGIAKGLYTEKQMDIFHNKMQDTLKAIGAHIDAFAFCPHHPNGSIPHYTRVCACRKPEPQMILDLVKRFSIIKEESFLIGDKESDIEAGKRAGLASYLFNETDLWHFINAHISE